MIILFRSYTQKKFYQNAIKTVNEEEDFNGA